MCRLSPFVALVALLPLAAPPAPALDDPAARIVDCNNNGVDDLLDILPFDPDGDGHVSSDCNGNAIPDECEGAPQLARLVAASPGPADQLGYAVAASGDTVVLGAPQADGVGRAYVFRRFASVWQQVDKLAPGGPGDAYAQAVAIDGNTILIGAPFDDIGGTGLGAVYVFTETGGVWSEVQKLTASDGVAFNVFGASVAIDGDTALIGATHDDQTGANSGAAYVFRRIAGTWQEVAKLTADDGADEDRFGASVALADGVAVVGAPWDDDAGAQSGSAYVFASLAGTWPLAQKLVPADGGPADQFGGSVAIRGNTLVVGGRYSATFGINGGGAYVYRHTGAAWKLATKLIPVGYAENQVVGNSVAIAGDTIVVGAVGDLQSGLSSGAAYAFAEVAGQWRQVAALRSADAAEGDLLGWDVAWSGSTAIITAPYNDGNGAPGDLGGAAYVFEPAATADCDGNGVPDSCELLGRDCNGNGFLDRCEFFAADLNGDNAVDFDDFSTLSSCWGQACGDMTGDATTDFADFAVLAGQFGCDGD